MGSLKKIGNKLTLSQRAYEEIKRAIIKNDIKPGQILTEEGLATEMGISRTPIRSAIKLLERDNLVTINSSKNIIVSEFSKDMIIEMSEARVAIEPEVAYLIANKITDEQIKKLKKIYDEQRKACESNNSIIFMEKEFEFHVLIAEYSDNRWLIDIVENLNTAYSRVLMLSGTLESYSEIAVEEHKLIISALESGNGNEAKEAMNNHLENVNSRIFNDLNKQSK